MGLGEADFEQLAADHYPVEAGYREVSEQLFALIHDGCMAYLKAVTPEPGVITPRMVSDFVISLRRDLWPVVDEDPDPF